MSLEPSSRTDRSASELAANLDTVGAAPRFLSSPPYNSHFRGFGVWGKTHTTGVFVEHDETPVGEGAAPMVRDEQKSANEIGGLGSSG
jgi:hypothetical protein